MQNVTLKIDGMSCGHCVRAVRGALEALPGVQVRAVEVGSAEIEVGAPEQLERLKAAIEEEGFQVIDQTVTT